MTGPSYLGGILQVQAYKAIQDCVYAALKDYGLNPTQWFILGSISANNSVITSAEIAVSLRVEPPLITMLINELCKRDLVIKKSDEADRRVKKLALTVKGRSLVKKAEAALQTDLKKLLAGVSEPQMRTYTDVLEKIIANA